MRWTHVYVWRNNPVRRSLYGQRCRVLASGRMGTVLIETESGALVTTSRRALRKITWGVELEKQPQTDTQP